MEQKQLSSSALAFVGDAVFTLYVREQLTLKYDYKSGELTKMCAKIVSAKNQAKILLQLEEFLTADEFATTKRCRNSHSFGFAKNASIGEYRRATGFEGLIGELHLKNDPRLPQILSKSLELSQEHLI